MFMRPCATWLGIYISNSLSDKGGANGDKKKDTTKEVSKGLGRERNTTITNQKRIYIYIYIYAYRDDIYIYIYS